jgi:hypothetical protein
VSVFLRWGIFGILGVAALVYAYNASKRMAETHAAQSVAPALSAPAAPTSAAALPPPPPAAAPIVGAADDSHRAPPAQAHCEAELIVAQRAIDMRKQGAPLDRLLRIQEIAWQEPLARRQRLEKVATRWYSYEGEFLPAALRIAVISDCVQSSPVP